MVLRDAHEIGHRDDALRLVTRRHEHARNRVPPEQTKHMIERYIGVDRDDIRRHGVTHERLRHVSCLPRTVTTDYARWTCSRPTQCCDPFGKTTSICCG